MSRSGGLAGAFEPRRWKEVRAPGKLQAQATGSRRASCNALPAPAGRQEEGRSQGSTPPAGQKRGWSGSRLSEPLGPESGTPCRPRRLTAPRAPQPQPRPGPTRGAHPGSAGRARGTHGGAGPGLPPGGAATRCALLRSAGASDTEPNTARPDRGRGATRSGRLKAGAGRRQVPRAPRPFSESPRELRGLCVPRASHPSLAAQRGAAAPIPSLEGVEGWVWGRGRVWGRTRRRGCLCGRAQLGSPPVSLCLSSSLLLLRAEPGMGGPAPGRPGTVMWKLGILGAGRWDGGDRE